ncbi:activator-dependent family glycosyltransferase [Amycolatopsis anabasis]|uniref:activator-dependent family glycosyltransferase n=1 Tax=Amycolatopsis anabasis TaxID=1840409 RepID=UPI00131CB58A|nr:activator-dependent family glycosyltransferase [Amycolatopsis anabasis]
MRVLFATYSEKTLFLAMAPLAWALRTAGHEVRIASQPKLVDAITNSGLTAVPVGRDHIMWDLMKLGGETEVARGGPPPPFDIAEYPPDKITWDHLLRGYEEVVPVNKLINERMIGDLVAFARHWRPDLVIWEPDTYAAPIAAKASGAVHARLLWSLDFFGIARRHFVRLKQEQRPEERADPLADWLGAHARRHGFEFTEDMTVGRFTIDQFPASLRMETDLQYVPMRYVPYNGTAVIPDWLREPPRRPRVCLTLGTTATDRFGGFAVSVGEILHALSDLDIELVATLPDGERDKLGRIPDNARIVPFVPLHALLPTCSAVIHHAGFGTLCTAGLYEVPQLVLPDHFDEPPLARRLVEQGAALGMPAREATGDKVRDQLVQLLEDPSFRHDAARLRDEMLAMPAPNDLVPELEKLVAEHREG